VLLQTDQDIPRQLMRRALNPRHLPPLLLLAGRPGDEAGLAPLCAAPLDLASGAAGMCAGTQRPQF
jgi:hypothetical protein